MKMYLYCPLIYVHSLINKREVVKSRPSNFDANHCFKRLERCPCHVCHQTTRHHVDDNRNFPICKDATAQPFPNSIPSLHGFTPI